jgi:hypothetical protein
MAQLTLDVESQPRVPHETTGAADLHREYNARAPEGKLFGQ